MSDTLATTKPPLGDTTPAQSSMLRLHGAQTLFAGGQLWGAGGSSSNPLNFPGWLNPYYGSYEVYRWMLQHPTIRHARSEVTSRIIASTWGYEADDGVPEEAVKFIEECFDNIRRRLVEDVLRALDFGHACFEPVWKIEDGKYCPDYFKPLSVDYTTIVADDGGRFTGFDTSLKPGTKKDGPDLRADRLKAWLYTYDGESGNLYGRSRLENIRATAWTGWLQCAQQLMSIGVKLGGRQAYAMVPSGSYVIDATGATRTFAQDAADALNAFAEGKSPVLTNLSAEVDDPELAAKLATASLTTFETIDFGSYSPSIAGLLDQLRHYEELIFEGWLRSPRTGMESKHGSRADAEQHTDTGVVDSELIDDDIAQQLQPIVDAVATLNFGLAPNSISIKPAPLISSKTQTHKDLLTAMLADPTLSESLARVIDVPKVLEGLDIPVSGPFEMGKLLDEAAQKKAELAPKPIQQPQLPGPPNGPPPQNGNGQGGNGSKVPASLQRLGNRVDRLRGR